MKPPPAKMTGRLVVTWLSHVAAVKHHGAVDERLAVLRSGAEAGDELVEEAHVLFVDALGLGDLLLACLEH